MQSFLPNVYSVYSQQILTEVQETHQPPKSPISGIADGDGIHRFTWLAGSHSGRQWSNGQIVFISQNHLKGKSAGNSH